MNWINARVRAGIVVSSLLLACGCIFGAGASNSGTGEDNNDESTNSGTTCEPVEPCIDDICGMQDDGCGAMVNCGTCPECQVANFCEFGLCGIVEDELCGEVDCGEGGQPLSSKCAGIAYDEGFDVGVSPCGEHRDPICEGDTIDCGPCGSTRACTTIDAGSFCCASVTEICTGNPGHTGLIDAQDGCGERMVVCDTDPPLRPVFAQMAAGQAHTCGLTENGDVYCWGDKSSGVMGEIDPATPKQFSPLLVQQVPGAEKIVSGGRHVCVLGGDVVRCWGDNTRQQVGPVPAGQTTSSFVVPGDPSAQPFVVAGATHTCAGRRGGELSCWGDNEDGQVAPSDGRQSIFPPVVIQDSTGQPLLVKRAFSGPAATYTCYVTNDDELGCFGTAPPDVLSTDSSPPEIVDANEDTPALGAGLRGIAFYSPGARSIELLGTSNSVGAAPITQGVGDTRSLHGGLAFFCGVIGAPDAEVRCAGDNSFGQLGIGDQMPTRFQTPVPLLPGGAQGLSVGALHACAVGHDGFGRCWGANGEGQLGTGDEMDRELPTEVVAPVQL